MVSSIRFTSFLLIFLLLPLIRFSTAHTQHQGKKRMLVITTGSKLEMARSEVNVEIHHGVLDQRVRFLPRRKMMSRGVFSKSNNNGNIAKSSTTKEKALCLIGKCSHEEGKGILNVKRKLSKRSSHYTKAKMMMSGFVPLNADYYVPRPHPPKNN